MAGRSRRSGASLALNLHFDRRALVLLMAAGVSIAKAVYSLPNIGRDVDFLAFYQAARAMLHGGDPYSAQNFVSAPGLAALLEPLARLPFRAAYWVFTVVTGLLGAATVVLVGRDLGWRHPELLAAGALVSWIGFSGLLQVQVDTLLLTVLLGVDARQGRRRGVGRGPVLAQARRDVAAGGLRRGGPLAPAESAAA